MVLVFCGSKESNNALFIDAAKNLAKTIVEEEQGLIYGGGNIGLMGIIAREVLHYGGHVTGIIPQFLMEFEVGNLDVTELIIVKSMHERKALMCDKADYIIAMPGGFGTLDELFEMLTWLQLGLHSKPIGVLNIDGFFDHLLLQLDRMVSSSLLSVENRKLIQVDSDPARLLKTLREIA